MDDGAAVRFDGLGHAYRRGRWVFRGCSGVVRRGRVLAVLGANGCGKTTLLRLLVGAGRPVEGTIGRHGRIALVPQLFQPGFDYSVLDMVLMGRARHVGLFAQPSRADEAAALAALGRFGLADRAGRPFHELSGGQRQMVILARALVSEAETLVLDEPASALDLHNQSVVLEWLHRLSRPETDRAPLAVMFTTHHPHHALAVADDVLLMLGAERFLFGPVAEVLTEANLQTLYGVPMKRVSLCHGGRAVESFVPVLLVDGRRPEV